MDQERFDRLTKSLGSGHSRRSVLRGIVAGLAAGLGMREVSADHRPNHGGGGGNPQGRCREGFTNCRGTCVKLDSNPEHCGACFTVCSPDEVCLNGSCSCPSGQELVNGSCQPLDPCANVNCDDGNPCTTDICSGGTCSHENLPDDTPCGEDGEMCLMGTCVP